VVAFGNSGLPAKLAQIILLVFQACVLQSDSVKDIVGTLLTKHAIDIKAKILNIFN